ncbi:NAD-binding lipoprotein [Streptomyces venezuelae]|uniref:NAD-binding lipoprotein n=1 Tax=Streptomyces venezuelae TaxID=54571 RepID=A0A5P2D9Y2_STRVZ|nr:NAD-binding lipoprotein [Streptomyces venezuelae]QES51370.1 NAD-binding lipoprotein [Streptomyces venezuelae]
MAQHHPPSTSASASLRLRLRYRFDNLVAGGTAALIGWFALACLAVVVPASAVLVWSDPSAPATLSGRLAAVWASVGQTLKIGGALGSPVHVLASVSLALVALLFVSTLVSLITTGINRRIMSLRLGHSTVLETGHTVVLGWSDQVFPVVGELVAANANQRRSAIAVLAPKDKVEMEDEIATRFTDRDRGRTRIICRNGSTTDPAELCRVSPQTAQAVLVLPAEGDAGAPAGADTAHPGRAGDLGNAGDAQVVKTLLALGAAVPDTCGAVVVAAVRDARNHLTARLAAGRGGHVLCVDDIVARLLVQTARQPGLSLVYQELLDFAGDEFYSTGAEELAGRTFGEALLSFATSSAVGLLHADGRVALNPEPGTPIAASDRIIVISRDDDTVVREDMAGCVDETAIVPAAGPRTPLAERLLLLGWNRRAPLVVAQLDQYVGPGSILDVVALDPAATPLGAGDRAASQLRHLEVSFHSGDITDPEVLAKLDVPGYDGVIVMGEHTEESSTDDRTLVTLLHLRAIGETADRELALTTEMSDDGNRLLAPAREGADFIVSGRLISLLMTQISESRHLADVFEELFRAEGNELYLKPAADYVRTGVDLTFATAVEAARRRGACAVGYRLGARACIGPDYGVRINPDKRQRVRFTEGDSLIVLAED